MFKDLLVKNYNAAVCEIIIQKSLDTCSVYSTLLTRDPQTNAGVPRWVQRSINIGGNVLKPSSKETQFLVILLYKHPHLSIFSYQGDIDLLSLLLSSFTR